MSSDATLPRFGEGTPSPGPSSEQHADPTETTTQQPDSSTDPAQAQRTSPSPNAQQRQQVNGHVQHQGSTAQASQSDQLNASPAANGGERRNAVSDLRVVIPLQPFPQQASQQNGQNGHSRESQQPLNGSESFEEVRRRLGLTTQDIVNAYRPLFENRGDQGDQGDQTTNQPPRRPE